MSENKLVQIRHTFTDESCISDYKLNSTQGMILCNCLEDPDRGLTQDMPLEEIQKIKVFGKTAIPCGTYPLKKVWSPRLKQWVWQICNVPGFDKIYMHSLNQASESLGCPGPGTYVEGKPNWVSNSRNMTKYIYGIIEKFDIKTIEILKAGRF